MFAIGITDHVEGPRERPSREIYAEVCDLARLADELGIEYFWVSEHHAHTHEGHLPAPLLLALHVCGQTRRIRPGTAIICLNLHHPLAVAEQVAVADALSDRRLAVGFGSGSTPEEFELFGLKVTEEVERHDRFAEALRVMQQAWSGQIDAGELRYFDVPRHDPLPAGSADLAGRCWLAVNSLGSARIAAKIGFNMLFSHLRTVDEYRQYVEAYRSSGGHGLIAANRPVFVGPDDDDAFAAAEPALRTLWRRFRSEGKMASDIPEPTRAQDLCAHPINFLVGGPATIARQLKQLHQEVPFDVANLEIRWTGLSHELVRQSLKRLATEVRPLLRA